jgi:hypothetical protein
MYHVPKKIHHALQWRQETIADIPEDGLEDTNHLTRSALRAILRHQ